MRAKVVYEIVKRPRVPAGRPRQLPERILGIEVAVFEASENMSEGIGIQTEGDCSTAL
jgi:hypothetical protein